MAYKCCLAGVDPELVPLFSAVFLEAGRPALVLTAPLEVTALGKLRPELLVCDVDAVAVDALELLRRIRFVLPECLIVVYTAEMTSTWGMACHLAGVNCMLSKDSTPKLLAQGVHSTLRSGCYTDPRFAAA